MRASVTGPILTKVWHTPDNGYAERFKHVVEPEFVIQRTTKFDDYDQIVKIDAADYTYGGTTRVTYGVTNRFLARRRAGADGASAPRVREFLNVQLQQRYYTDAHASTVDGAYAGGFYGKPPSNFSPIALSVRANPTNAVGASLASTRTRKPASSRRSRPTAPSTPAPGCDSPAAGASANTCKSSTRNSGRRTTSSARAPP